MEVKISIHLDRYIASPYWPEREQLIQIGKESGVSLARTPQTRRKALDTYLASVSMTRAEYEDLERAASRPFYTSGDGLIIVPPLQVMGMIVAACDRIGARDRPCPMELARTLITVTPWTTGKTAPDGVWERYAVVTGSTGTKLSNQRALRRDPYIQDTAATGTISFDEAVIQEKILFRALSWAGNYVGIGASRKMGWGRFTLTPA